MCGRRVVLLHCEVGHGPVLRDGEVAARPWRLASRLKRWSAQGRRKDQGVCDAKAERCSRSDRWIRGCSEVERCEEWDGWEGREKDEDADLSSFFEPTAIGGRRRARMATSALSGPFDSMQPATVNAQGTDSSPHAARSEQ